MCMVPSVPVLLTLANDMTNAEQEFAKLSNYRAMVDYADSLKASNNCLLRLFKIMKRD